MRPPSLVPQWKVTDSPEIQALLALVILMGVAHKVRFTLYWSTDSLISTQVFSQVKSRDIFLILIRFPYFADNTKIYLSDPDYDKLYKLKKGVFMFFSPGKDVNIDESPVGFKGRLGFKQYIKSKTGRFGIKLYQLCTSNGILFDFTVYHGNITPQLTEMDNGALITERILLWRNILASATICA